MITIVEPIGFELVMDRERPGSHSQSAGGIIDPPVTLRQRALEELMLGLRTYAGIDLERFERKYGTSLMESNRARILRFRDEGLIELDANFVRPTVRGLAVADALAASLDVASIPLDDPGART